MSPRILRANFLFDQGRTIEAEAEIRAALQEGDDSAYPHALLGLCLMKAGLVVDARREMRHAFEREPNWAYNHYAMSFIKEAALVRTDFFHRRKMAFDLKVIRASQESAEKAVALAPNEERYLVRLAEILQTQRKWAQSLAPAEAALRQNPGNCAAAVKLAEALTRLKRPREAKDVLHRALEMNPAASLAHAGMGWALLRVGDYQRAEQFFQEALRTHADLEWAQEGALECAKQSYLIHRWISSTKRWFYNRNVVVAAILVLAFVGVLVGALSIYFDLADPVLRKYLGNSGSAYFTLALIFGCSVLFFFHDQILLWLVRRHAAGQTSVGTRHRHFANLTLIFIGCGIALGFLDIVVSQVSKITPAIIAGLIPGIFSIFITVKTFPRGKKRNLWLAYVLLLLVASPIAVVAYYKYMEQIPELMHIALIMFLPFLPLIIACETESKRALKQKHANAVAKAAQGKSLKSSLNRK